MHRQLSGFLAFYHFGNSSSKAKSINGIRFRSNYNFTGWFAVEGECSKDKVAGLVSYLGVKLNWSPSANKSKTSLRKRMNKKMTQLPVRDIDVVNQEVDLSKQLFEYLAKGKVHPYIHEEAGSSIQIDSNIEVVRSIEELNALKAGKASNFVLLQGGDKSPEYMGVDNDLNKVELVSGDKKKYAVKEADSKVREKFKAEKINTKVMEKTNGSDGVAKQAALKNVTKTKIKKKTISYEEAVDQKMLSSKDAITASVREQIGKNPEDTKAIDNIIKKASDINTSNEDIVEGLMSVFIPESKEEAERMYGDEEGGNQGGVPPISGAIINGIAKHLTSDESELDANYKMHKTDVIKGAKKAFQKGNDKTVKLINEPELLAMYNAKKKAGLLDMHFANMILEREPNDPNDPNPPNNDSSFLTEKDLYDSGAFRKDMIVGAVLHKENQEQRNSGNNNPLNLDNIFNEQRNLTGNSLTPTEFARGYYEYRQGSGDNNNNIRERLASVNGITRDDALVAEFAVYKERGVPIKNMNEGAMEEIIDGKMNNKADALKYGEYVAAAQQNGVTEDTILDNSLGGLFEKVSSPDHTKMIVKLADEIEVSQNSIVKTAYNKNIPKGHLDALIPEGILTAVAINAFYNP
ncbi:MAG: hypothetical protein HRT87_04025 [Legionellales bacterium]|nr:hypothetical protein [Legionellales bacterium]